MQRLSLYYSFKRNMETLSILYVEETERLSFLYKETINKLYRMIIETLFIF